MRSRRQRRRRTLTLSVYLLYGKILGMRLKKLSSYSPRTTALRATWANVGLSAGGNLPFTHDSGNCVEWNASEVTGSSLPLAIAAFNDSIICSSSGWNERRSVRLFFMASLWSSEDFLFLSSSSVPLEASLVLDPTVAKTPAGLSRLTFLLLGFLVGLGIGSVRGPDSLCELRLHTCP